MKFYFIKNKEKFGSLKLKTFAEIFSFFDLLLFEEQLLKSWVNLIEKYGLKTHDALIVAACKHYDVRYLISLDEDFERVCEEEEIVQIDSATKLKKILEMHG